MSQTRFACLGCIVCAALPIIMGCSRESASVHPQVISRGPAPAAAPAPGVPLAPADIPEPYPPGKWRAAPPEELARTVLWLSHILVRHRETEEAQVSFNMAGWVSTQPHSTRTRREALELAARLAQRARAEGNFEALAGEFSEDPATAVRGGSLGGVVARGLMAWPQVLDAIATLQPGGVSDVVATEYGYHVLYRRAPVPDLIVSGSHIVIAHADAPWIQTAARGELPARSREDAFALARSIYERARDRPAEFFNLVQEYSEHRDAVRGGDFGTWSTREPCDYPREIETLSQLEVGETAEPIDTLFGVQVIRRTGNRPRQRYAAAQLQFPYDSEQPDDHPMSKLAVYKAASQVIEELHEDPSRFEELQRRWCCVGIWDIMEGRELPELEATLAALAPGQIASQPVPYGTMQYLIPKRVNLELLPQGVPTRYELPGSGEL